MCKVARWDGSMEVMVEKKIIQKNKVQTSTTQKSLLGYNVGQFKVKS
jgi:hypothetical protein